MKIAIMQPYFLPYIGYWQLIKAVDRFVVYDDVAYINRGWVNRNRLLINGKPHYMTIPLSHASQNKKICDTFISASFDWRQKLLKTVKNTYRKAPYFEEVFEVIERLIRHETDNLSDFLVNQLITLSAFMGMNTDFVLTSRTYDNHYLTGQERIIDICKRERASTYVNLKGGQDLYEHEPFHNSGIDLCFIAMNVLDYKQRYSGFVPHLSIIDALMELGPIDIKRHLEAFSMVGNAA